MNEWERIKIERDSECKESQNAQIINKQLQGKRMPEINEVIEKLRIRYSKYGKEHKNE